MKPFRFRADVLMAPRRKRRDEAQASVANAQRAAREAAASVEHAEARVRDAIGACAEALREAGEPHRLERHRNWIAYLQADAMRLRGVLDERTQAVTAALDVLLVAHQDVRVLERLRDRLWRRHQQAARVEEMKEIDQMATLRHARRVIQEGSDV